MTPTPNISGSIAGTDLSPRLLQTSTVAASPSGSSETVIATLTPSTAQPAVVTGIRLDGWAAYTVGTSGVSVRFVIRQTNISGAVVADTGALAKTAGSRYADTVRGFDASPLASGVYVLTMIVASGAATSTVSAVSLAAQVV